MVLLEEEDDKNKKNSIFFSFEIECESGKPNSMMAAAAEEWSNRSIIWLPQSGNIWENYTIKRILCVYISNTYGCCRCY